MRKLLAVVVCVVMGCMVSAASAKGLSIDIQRVGIDLKITTTDESGQLCDVCDVEIKDSDGTPLVVGRTDRNGIFEFDISGLELIKITVSGPNGEVVEKEVDNALGSNRKKYAERKDVETAVVTDDGKTKVLADGSVVEGPPFHQLAILLILVALVFFVVKFFRLVSKKKDSSL